MPQSFLAKHHRVDQDLIAEVFAELALHDGAVLRIASARRFRPAEIRRQVAARVRRADAQPGKLVERPIENQMREKDRRLERIADGVAQSAAAAQPLVLRRARRVARVHEHEHAELLHFRPERIEFRRRQLLAFDAAADGGAAQPEPLDSVFQLLGRQIGKLQRHRREPDEPIRMRRAPRGELLVLDGHDLARELAFGRVPERVDAQDLHVDPLLVDRFEAFGAEHETAFLIAPAPSPAALGRELRTFNDVADFGDRQVAVDVDHLDAPAADGNFAPWRRLDEEAGGGAGAGLDECSAGQHGGSSDYGASDARYAAVARMLSSAFPFAMLRFGTYAMKPECAKYFTTAP